LQPERSKIMKLKRISLTLALGLAGCGKNDSTTTTAEDTAAKTAETAKAEAAKADAAKVQAANTEAARVEAAKVEAARVEAARVEAAKADAAKADAAKVEAARDEAARVEAAKVEAARVEAAKNEAAKLAAAKAADSAKAQGLIDKAKTLIAEGKFTEASSVLQQLAGQSLSSDQAKLVDGLKEQIQKALVAKATADAAGSAGNLLKR
jgi:type IV secretory pathway VirB10-like protein